MLREITDPCLEILLVSRIQKILGRVIVLPPLITSAVLDGLVRLFKKSVIENKAYDLLVLQSFASGLS